MFGVGRSNHTQLSHRPPTCYNVYNPRCTSNPKSHSQAVSEKMSSAQLSNPFKSILIQKGFWRGTIDKIIGIRECKVILKSDRSRQCLDSHSLKSVTVALPSPNTQHPTTPPPSSSSPHPRTRDQNGSTHASVEPSSEIIAARDTTGLCGELTNGDM